MNSNAFFQNLRLFVTYFVIFYSETGYDKFDRSWKLNWLHHEQEDNIYTIGCNQGIIGVKYTRGQFDACSSSLITLPQTPPRTLTQTEAMRKASIGIDGGPSCRYQNCRANRCPCGTEMQREVS